MAKGALAIGVGAALLLGGGGTLAVWNQTEAANAGQITAGELKMTPQTATWANSFGEPVDINSYKIVPGEALTYSQNLDVLLEGEKMKALITVDNSKLSTAGFSAGDLVVAAPKLAKAGVALADPILTPDTDGMITASTTITFNNVTALSSVKAKAALGTITYKLDQQVPAAKK